MLMAASGGLKRGSKGMNCVSPLNSFRQYHNRKDPLASLLYLDPDTEVPIVDKVLNALALGSNGKIGPKVLTPDFSDAKYLDDPYDPEFSVQPEVTKAFTRFKAVEPELVPGIMSAAARHLREKKNANGVMKKPADVKKDSEVLSFDKRCANRRYEFVFIDTSEGVDIQDRFMYVRERDGTLRSATHNERLYLESKYYPQQHRPYLLPYLYTSADDMANALLYNKHVDILDGICRMRSSDDATYISTHLTVYKDIIKNSTYSLLQDTHHFYGLGMFLFMNKKVDDLVKCLLERDRIHDANIVANAYHSFHPKSASAKKVKERSGRSKTFQDLREFVFASSDVTTGRLLTTVLDKYERKIMSEELYGDDSRAQAELPPSML